MTPSNKKRILFVCIHNSARSQMAEAWMNYYCSDFFYVQSAGLEPGVINPLVIESMKDVGIDILFKKTQSGAELLRRNEAFDYVITVCDEASAERCPVFPGSHQRIHWGFPDPSQFSGSKEEKLEKIKAVRDAIKVKIEKWCSCICIKEAVHRDT